MEKQLIDDLFARKLREAELPPSPDAFSRLQSRMASNPLPTPQRRVAVWWYGAAAASLLLITLFYYRNNLLPKQSDSTTLAAQPKVPKAVAIRQTEPVTAHIVRVEESTRQDRQHKVLEAGNVANEQITTRLASTEKPAMVENTTRYTALRTTTPAPETLAVNQITVEQIVVKAEAVATTAHLMKSVQEAPQPTPATPLPSKQQRVVVLTIEEPKAEVPIVALQPTRVESIAQAQSGSLADLVAKVKQLKKCDALARVTPAKRPPDSRSRFGRVFEGVKESLKNETTLE